jgi:DNA segregation ATPase FtsK/SpoIIIE-like protein
VLEDIGREMARTGLVITQIRDSDRLALDVPRKTRECIPINDGLSRLPDKGQLDELWIPIGVTPEGEHIIRDLGKMPHLLVGGTTGAGKTIFLYGLLSAMLSTHPDSKQLRIVLSTSKREDFSFMDGMKHLEGRKVIDDAAVAIRVLQNKIQEEFNTRGNVLTQSRCRDIIAYNLTHKEKMSPIVILVDEFADLADQLGPDRQAKQAFYTNIRRVAQLGRNRGMHLVLCTQRPSAELVPSNIRSLLNSRVAFNVNKREDSRMIIDTFGAEQLQLHGDMLFRDDKSLIRCLGYFTEVDFLVQVLSKCK